VGATARHGVAWVRYLGSKARRAVPSRPSKAEGGLPPPPAPARPVYEKPKPEPEPEIAPPATVGALLRAKRGTRGDDEPDSS
jgi:hypothetical protein